MKFVYGALLLIASITPTTFIGLKLYKYATNKYIAAFSTTDGIKIANAASFLLACAFLLFHSVTAFHYLPNRRYTFGNVKVTVVPPYELFLSSTVINKSVAIF